MECVYKGNMVEIIKVSETLYYRKGNLKERRQCNGAYIVGERSVAAIDVASMESGAEMLAEVRQLFKKPLRHIFITHDHDDHSDGVPAIKHEDLTIYCSHKFLPSIEAKVAGGRASVFGVRGWQELSREGLRLKLFTLEDTMHSPGDMFVYHVAEGALMTGDAVVDYPVLFFHSSDPERWVANLREGLVPLGARCVLPGHGDVYPAARIEGVAAHISALIDAARGLLTPFPGDWLGGNDSSGRLNEVVAEFLGADSDAAKRIKAKAKGDAQRELRMVLRRLLYGRLP